MTAFDEYDKERREIDELLFKGYTIEGIREDLDGAVVKFVRKPGSGTEAGSGYDLSASEEAVYFHQREVKLELPLLTADARKYVVARFIELKRN